MDQIAVTVGSSSLPESLSSSTPRRAKRVQSPTSKVANDHPDDDEEENSPESEIDEVQSPKQESHTPSRELIDQSASTS